MNTFPEKDEPGYADGSFIALDKTWQEKFLAKYLTWKQNKKEYEKNKGPTLSYYDRKF
jgi:hypothetical protein